jgi:hypothetical protein
MKIAVVATLLLCNFHANPYGPELQVKQMLDGRRFRGANNKERETKGDYCEKKISKYWCFIVNVFINELWYSKTRL